MTPTAAAARKTCVMIVAQSAERRAHLRDLLSADSEFQVTARDTDYVPRHDAQPVIVLVDVGAEGSSLAGILPATRGGVVVLSDRQDLNWVTHTFPREPVALLSRDCERKQFVAAIRAVADGLTVLEPETFETVLRRSAESVALEPGEEELTSRETEVLHMMTAGLTNREIATALGISDHTVKFHIASIFGKLGTSTRTETVTEGIRRGLILL
jgi:DNA-binding NarL/FixJ family response regulator